MDATFLKILRELEWDSLTISQAGEVMTALREAVAKGEAWFQKFSAGFVNGNTTKFTPHPIQAALASAKKVKVILGARRGGGRKTLKRAPQPRNVIEVPPVKRGRGRPRKVMPEIAGVEQGRLARPITSKSAGSTPAPATADDHPPIGVLQGSYVSTTGPDPNRAYSLPPTHPRATGAALPASADPDFAAVEAGKVRFQ